MASPPTRCGTFALAGAPNAGKSTLLNALVGEPLAIVSSKPQSTRLPVVGIRSDATAQLIFTDPPGLLDPAYLLQHAMLEAARGLLQSVDAILYLHPLDLPGPPPPLADLLPDTAPLRAPVALVRTKADRVPDAPPPAGPDELHVSAATGQGLDALLAWCVARAPAGPFRHDPDDVSTQPVRFFVAEFVREAAFECLDEEVPYSLATEVDEFREGSDPLYIRVTLYVERDSQKGIVVGRGGRTIRQIGAAARARTETFLGQPVYLDLWVKTLPRWRSTPGALTRFGFPLPPARPG